MTHLLDALWLAAASPAASIVAKATVAAAIGLIAVRLARASRAALRHAWLASTFAVLLLLPAAAVIAPPLRIAMPAVAPTPMARAIAASTTLAPAPARSRIASPRSGFAALSPSSLWLSAWIAGAVLVLLPVLAGLYQVRSLRRSAKPWLRGQALLRNLSLDSSARRPIQVLLHAALPGPMTCGLLHPAIVLSQDADTWDDENLTRALLHEWEHVRRCDWITHCLARAVCAAWWFHPLVWIAWRRLALEAERACDDGVLRGSDPAAYADQLVSLAQRLSSSAGSPLLAMASRADLGRRVAAVLDPRQRRGRAGVPGIALACAAAIALVCAIAPLTMVAAPQAPVAPRPGIRFAANTALVIVDVVVTKDGKPVSGMAAGDFAITEDGVPQHIAIFELQKTGDSIPGYYVLGYYPMKVAADVSFRNIKVTAPQLPMVTLDYRAGYYIRSSDTRPAAPPDRPAVTPLDPSIRPPALLYKREPVYSEEARKAKYQGAVLLNVEIDTAGRVSDVHVLRGLGLGLDEQAIEAVRQWRYRPAMKDGKPLAIQVEVEVRFSLF